MLIYKIYTKIALISPFVEITLKKLYWKNIRIFKALNPHNINNNSCISTKSVDIKNIIQWLKSKGIGKGDLLVVHSSYFGLQSTGLSPDQIIDILLDIIGPTGTLAMPVIRFYKEEPKKQDILDSRFDNLICTYDVKRTTVSSGLIPFRLMRRKGSVISQHPLNPLCALGPLAKGMMENNLHGAFPSPHGANSSWRFCYDNNAKVISLGTDIEHHNTMVHVAEESFGDWKWNDEEWYQHRIFNIIDEHNNTRQIVVSERKPKWGLLHFTEIRMNNDLKKLGIMQVAKIEDEIEVGYVDARKFISFLRSKKGTGYPYYV